MSAVFHLHQNTLSVDDFVQYVNTYEPFECLEIAQKFVAAWTNDKQFFDQKTSGSTGKPTVHKISRGQMLASAQRTVNALKLQQGQNALVCINMGFIGGKMMLVRGLSFDWQLHLIAPTSFARTADIPQGRFDFAAMVPMQIENLLKTTKGRVLLNNIDQIIVGGAPTGKHLIEQLQGLDCTVYATYGMTETVSHVALQALNGPNRSDDFQMLAGIHYRQDDRGCLAIQADVTNQQWIQTNDVVIFKDEDTFRILGRADNVINSGGVKIQIETLEAKLAPVLHGKVADYAITSQKDKSLGQKVILVCEGLTSDKNVLMDLLKQSLNRYEVPKAILAYKIPKTPTDKTDRNALRQKISEA